MSSFRTVFLTGASSGLGRGLALHYARSGATVFAAARRKAELEALVNEAGAGKVVPLVLDVLDTDALVSGLAFAEDQSGGALDLVIANAGIGAPTHAQSMDWRTVKRILDVNASGACVTLAAALPKMVERNHGTVVGISSLASFRGLPGNAAYSASKAALATFMESLRVDLKGTKVRAICIHPGFVKTELTAKVKHSMPFLMELDDAVAVMSKGIERGAPVIAYPLPTNLAIRTVSAMPRFLYEGLAGRMSPKPRKKLPKPGADAK